MTRFQWNIDYIRLRAGYEQSFKNGERPYNRKSKM